MTQRSKDGNAYTPQAEASWTLPRSPTYHLQINHLFLFKAFLPNAFYFFLGLTFAGGQSASLLLGYVWIDGFGRTASTRGVRSDEEISHLNIQLRRGLKG